MHPHSISLISRECSSLTRKKLEIIRKLIIRWGKDHYEEFPWRSTKNSFHALVAEVMLQRTKAEQVVPVYNAFTSQFCTAKEASCADPDDVLRLLAPLGLRWRAKKVLELSGEICRIGNTVPGEFEELCSLPGVGQYVACAFLSFFAEKRAVIVDANTIRLWTRVFGLINAREMRRNREFLCMVEKITPKKHFKAFNYAILDLTRNACMRKPHCEICPINSLCKYNENFVSL